MKVTGRLFDKVWDRHLVASPAGEPPLIYIDLHLVHEVTSPQAFEGLELAGRKVRRPDLTVATMDHDVPTVGASRSVTRPRRRPPRRAALTFGPTGPPDFDELFRGRGGGGLCDRLR